MKKYSASQAGQSILEISDRERLESTISNALAQMNRVAISQSEAHQQRETYIDFTLNQSNDFQHNYCLF